MYTIPLVRDGIQANVIWITANMGNWATCNGIFTQNNVGLFCNIFFDELDIADGIRCRVQTHERYFRVREATPLSFADNLLNIV